MTMTPEQLATNNTLPLNGNDIHDLVSLAEQDIADLLAKTTDTDPVVSKKAALAVYEINNEVLAAVYDFATTIGIDFHTDSEHSAGAKEALFELLLGYREVSKKNASEKTDASTIRPEMLEDTTESLPSILLAIAQGSVVRPVNPADILTLKDGYARQIKASFALIMQGVLLQEEKGEVVMTTPVFSNHVKKITTVLDASH